ncbi:hypothetical protein MKK84_05825 [Methylobacterium sp. E-065]|uniref:hypothetical protein n=1 Tax=Methylobacterium sp. E-065 TaxID=2836583 RepID=UPI001FBA42E8|nr:hypothetical protein [Methylobacterium sp. E-065]MCJ2016947.1 hypothetical protein [Methylobacterium sp. E-065]
MYPSTEDAANTIRVLAEHGAPGIPGSHLEASNAAVGLQLQDLSVVLAPAQGSGAFKATGPPDRTPASRLASRAE